MSEIDVHFASAYCIWKVEKKKDRYKISLFYRYNMFFHASRLACLFFFSVQTKNAPSLSPLSFGIVQSNLIASC